MDDWLGCHPHSGHDVREHPSVLRVLNNVLLDLLVEDVAASRVVSESRTHWELGPVRLHSLVHEGVVLPGHLLKLCKGQPLLSLVVEEARSTRRTSTYPAPATDKRRSRDPMALEENRIAFVHVELRAKWSLASEERFHDEFLQRSLIA